VSWRLYYPSLVFFFVTPPPRQEPCFLSRRYRKGQPPVGDFLSFHEARRYVRKLGLSTQQEWFEWSRDHRPEFIPSAPRLVYKDEGWLSFRDWLGYGEGLKKARHTFLPFEDARSLVRKQGLASQTHWKEWSRTRRPAYIPSSPSCVYKGQGWLSWPDWLGYGVGQSRRHRTKSVEFMEFEEARERVRNLGLGSLQEWQEWCIEGRTLNVPTNPHVAYAFDGWLSWADWLGFGEGQGPRGEVLEFEEARDYARALGLTSTEQWIEWSTQHRPVFIPSNPRVVYADEGWLSWRDWLGYGIGEGPSGDFLEFEEAREIVRGLGLKNSAQWYAWSRDHRPRYIPSNPHTV